MQTVEKINSILAKNNINLKIDESNINKSIKELGIDSIAIMSIIVKIEEELNITLDDEKLTNIKTIKDLVSIIDQTK